MPKSRHRAQPGGGFLQVVPLRRETYFNEVLMDVNCEFRVDPRPLTTAIMASAIPAAIRPYSIAVAPDSSDKKLNKVRFNAVSFEFSEFQLRSFGTRILREKI
jgi:hypothetical protein